MSGCGTLAAQTTARTSITSRGASAQRGETVAVDARKGYDLWADTYDDARNPVVAMDARHTPTHFGFAPGGRVLDAGCGTGRHFSTTQAAGCSPVGVDFSTGMLRVTRVDGFLLFSVYHPAMAAAGDDALVAELPEAARYRGFPMLFVLTARVAG